VFAPWLRRFPYLYQSVSQACNPVVIFMRIFTHRWCADPKKEGRPSIWATSRSGFVPRAPRWAPHAPAGGEVNKGSRGSYPGWETNQTQRRRTSRKSDQGLKVYSYKEDYIGSRRGKKPQLKWQGLSRLLGYLSEECSLEKIMGGGLLRKDRRFN